MRLLLQAYLASYRLLLAKTKAVEQLSSPDRLSVDVSQVHLHQDSWQRTTASASSLHKQQFRSLTPSRWLVGSTQAILVLLVISNVGSSAAGHVARASAGSRLSVTPFVRRDLPVVPASLVEKTLEPFNPIISGGLAYHLSQAERPPALFRLFRRSFETLIWL